MQRNRCDPLPEHLRTSDSPEVLQSNSYSPLNTDCGVWVVFVVPKAAAGGTIAITLNRKPETATHPKTVQIARRVPRARGEGGTPTELPKVDLRLHRARDADGKRRRWTRTASDDVATTYSISPTSRELEAMVDDGSRLLAALDLGGEVATSSAWSARRPRRSSLPAMGCWFRGKPRSDQRTKADAGVRGSHRRRHSQCSSRTWSNACQDLQKLQDCAHLFAPHRTPRRTGTPKPGRPGGGGFRGMTWWSGTERGDRKSGPPLPWRAPPSAGPSCARSLIGIMALTVGAEMLAQHQLQANLRLPAWRESHQPTP